MQGLVCYSDGFCSLFRWYNKGIRDEFRVSQSGLEAWRKGTKLTPLHSVLCAFIMEQLGVLPECLHMKIYWKNSAG